MQGGKDTGDDGNNGHAGNYVSMDYLRLCHWCADNRYPVLVSLFVTKMKRGTVCVCVCIFWYFVLYVCVQCVRVMTMETAEAPSVNSMRIGNVGSLTTIS